VFVIRGVLASTRDSVFSAGDGGVFGAQSDGKRVGRLPGSKKSLYYIKLLSNSYHGLGPLERSDSEFVRCMVGLLDCDRPISRLISAQDKARKKRDIHPYINYWIRTHRFSIRIVQYRTVVVIGKYTITKIKRNPCLGWEIFKIEKQNNTAEHWVIIRQCLDSFRF
jgi:hypothetical protein